MQGRWGLNPGGPRQERGVELKFPIEYYENNLIVNQKGEWWAAYRMRPFTYQHLNMPDQVSWGTRLSRLFSAVMLDGQLLMVPRVVSAASFMREQAVGTQTKAEDAREAGDTALAGLLDYGVDYLQDLGERVSTEQALEYDFYLLYKLARPNQSGLSWWITKETLVEAGRYLKELLYTNWYRRGIPLLAARALEAYCYEEEKLWIRLASFLKLDRCTAPEITRLIQSRYWAGLQTTPERPNWSPNAREIGLEESARIEPLRAEVQSLGSGVIDLSHPRRVAIHQVEDGAECISYQAFMPLSALPDEMTMPGTEYLFRLQDLPFPVTACIRWHPVGYRETIGKLRRTRLETRDQMEQAEQAGDLPTLDVLQADEQAEAWEQDLKERKLPSLETTVILSVAASDDKTLLRYVQAVRDAMTDEQMPVELSTGDQHRLFLEFLPGSPRQLKPTAGMQPDPPYLHRFTPEVLAAGMPGATHALGDPTGCFIGRTGVLQRPVVVQTSRGPQVNKSGSVAVLGTLGGGKTYLTRLMAFQTALTGGRVLWIDPKGESAELVQRLPEEIRENVNLISLSGGQEDTGLLDLLSMAKGGARREAGNTAVSVLGFMLNVQSKDEELAIMEAVESALREENPCMAHVVDALLAQEDGPGRQLGKYLSHLRNRAYANLLFGDGRERSLDVTAPYNILQLQNLQLPAPGKARADMTPEEVLSLGVLLAVVAFAAHYCTQDRHIFKTVVLDEAWKLTGTDQGLALVTHLIRTGRALNNAVYVISQSHRDLDNEGIRNNFGMKFVFKSQDEAEVRGLLRFLGLEDDPEKAPENLDLVKRLENGECLFQDLDGRVGVVQIDAVFTWIDHAFDTRPLTGAAVKARRNA